MLSGEHLLQKIDYASKEQSQKRHISLYPLGAQLCHMQDLYVLTSMGPVTGSPSLMSQTQCCSHHSPALDFPDPTPRLVQPGNKRLFCPLHVPPGSLLFFMGVKETL